MRFEGEARRGIVHVGERDRRVGIGACIQYDAIVAEARFVEFVDQVAFVVALEIVQGNGRIFGLEFEKKFFEGLASINFRFAHAQ